MTQTNVDPNFRVPKTSMHQECMQAVEDAIQDNIVGLTPELAQSNLEYVVDVMSDLTLVKYSGKEVLRFGFRGAGSEFFIDTKGAMSA